MRASVSLIVRVRVLAEECVRVRARMRARERALQCVRVAGGVRVRVTGIRVWGRVCVRMAGR
jgi:hypothetical protein